MNTFKEVKSHLRSSHEAAIAQMIHTPMSPSPKHPITLDVSVETMIWHYLQKEKRLIFAKNKNIQKNESFMHMNRNEI